MRTKQFSVLLALLSGLMFIFGDYVVAVLPKMVPACVLFQLGIVLLWFWIYDGVGNLSVAEHSVVILMIFVDLFLGAGPMILFGLFLTLILTIKRMMAMNKKTKKKNIEVLKTKEN